MQNCHSNFVASLYLTLYNYFQASWLWSASSKSELLVSPSIEVIISFNPSISLAQHVTPLLVTASNTLEDVNHNQ